MDEYIDLKILQYYRHDIMNELQLVHGYLHMGKVDEAKQKVTNWINDLNEERKLMYLDASQFIAWVLMFNHVHDQIRLTYSINIQTTLKHIDSLMMKHCKDFIQIIKTDMNETDFYHIHINLSKNNDSKLVIKLLIDGSQNEKNAMNQFKNIGNINELNFKITKKDSEIICTWEYSI